MTAHRLFLDGADRAALERGLDTGAVHGVTTNPTILRRGGVACTPDAVAALLRDVLAMGAREVQAQVWGGTRGAWLACGRALADVAPQVVVKVPMTPDGAAVAATLIAEGRRVTMTAVHGAGQVLAASAMGAAYAAPYHGRIGDGGRDAFGEIGAMLRIAQRGGATRLLVASIRSADDAAALAAMGCDTMTMAPEVFAALVSRDDTDRATAAFEADAKG